ncbi:MAG TPA: phosphoribosylformylglycinamidine synthase I [Planctomycetes bacterium]|nr:phosphoribosylformylglycinamidine synthase I [Planctomycetota bacterium]
MSHRPPSSQNADAPLALVLRAAGTNCDAELLRAFERAGARTRLLHLNALSADPALLEEVSILGLAGGFSYGDYVAAGRVFGAELRHRLDDPLRRYIERGGLVFGVCNGFQILIELGLLEDPGLAPSERGIALTDNASGRFECRWVTLRSEACRAPWIEAGERMPVPVAHAEGCFVVRDPEVCARLFANGQVALTYVDPAKGDAAQPASPDAAPIPYPLNPNGSVANIAGICDPTGRVLGLMPHPERNLDPWNHPLWTRMGAREEGEGLAFFRRMVASAAAPVPS